MTIDEAKLLQDDELLLTASGDIFIVDQGIGESGLNRHSYLDNAGCILVKENIEDCFAVAISHVVMSLGVQELTSELIERTRNEYPEYFI
jgi:hypothetical protein